MRPAARDIQQGNRSQNTRTYPGTVPELSRKHTQGQSPSFLDGLAVVLSVSLSRVSQPVYNIEVHGEHVYQVGELGVVVHNTCPGFHHFAPRAWGSNVPYGSKYLKKLSKSEHTDIHRGFSNFLKLRTGHYFNAKSGSEWQSMLDFRTRRGLLIEFHKTFENGIYWNDFVTEILKARKAGYNPWG